MKDDEWDEPYFWDYCKDGLWMPKADQKKLEKYYLDKVIKELETEWLPTTAGFGSPRTDYK